MNRTAIAALVCAVVLALALPGCSAPRPVTLPPGTTMERLHNAGRITVGVKSDQPGLGFRNPATGKYQGFDIRIAEIVAAALGLKTNQIRYVEIPTKDRESALIEGRVDIVVASYSITSERLQKVGQAGPYFVTGQQLLVREDDKTAIKSLDDLRDAVVCVVTASTGSQTAHDNRLKTTEHTRYTDCVRELLNASVRAVLTDGAVLRGYEAEQHEKLEVVGKPLTTERYGIGYRKGDLAFCQFLTDAIIKAERDGAWAKAFMETLGKAGAAIPANPQPDPC